MCVHASNEAEALIALQHQFKMKFNGEWFDDRKGKMNQFQRRIAKLRLSPDNQVRYFAKSVILQMLKQYPLISIEDTVNMVC